MSDSSSEREKEIRKMAEAAQRLLGRMQSSFTLDESKLSEFVRYNDRPNSPSGPEQERS
jgi:hypothetical protein